MAKLSSNLGLREWDSPTDHFSYEELRQNWDRIDAHNHTSGNGSRIVSGSLADGSVTTSKIATASVSQSKLSSDLNTAINGNVLSINAGSPLPTSPSDGTVLRIYHAPGKAWVFRYNSSSLGLSGYGWEWQGGISAERLQDNGKVSFTSTTLPNVLPGPTYSIPYSGYYKVSAQATLVYLVPSTPPGGFFVTIATDRSAPTPGGYTKQSVTQIYSRITSSSEIDSGSRIIELPSPCIPQEVVGFYGMADSSSDQLGGGALANCSIHIHPTFLAG